MFAGKFIDLSLAVKEIKTKWEYIHTPFSVTMISTSISIVTINTPFSVIIN